MLVWVLGNLCMNLYQNMNLVMHINVVITGDMEGLIVLSLQCTTM